MADLTQINGNQRIVMGWFGSCDDEGCEEYPLRTAEVVEAVDSIYEIHTDSTRAVAFHSHIYETLPDQTQSLESLKCGHSYYVALKAGDKTLTIEEFVIADESTTQERYVTVDDQCGGGGGGGGMANISFLTDSPSDNDDLRISIGADLTEINSLCTSNVWAYRIEKLNGETDESGTEVQGKTFASGDQDSVTVLSNYLSSADGGASWYKVYIQGYASDQTTAVTDEISENVFMGWPTPSLTINGTTCSQTEWTALWQTDGIVNEIPHTNSSSNVDLITACQTKNVSCLEYEGPSNSATFNLSKYLISDMTMAPIQGNNIPADQNLWEYSIDDGEYFPFVPETTITDASKLQVRLSAKDGNGDDWSPGNYSVDVIFGYKGMESSAATHVSYVKVNAEVKDRTIEIESLTDNRDLQVGFTLTLNNVTYWQFKFSGPSGEDTWPIRTSTTGSIAGAAYPGTYTMEAWGVSEIDGEWKIVTPVDSKTVEVEWPDPKLVPTSTINEGYEEESGPSAGNNMLTIIHNWVTEYKISMPENTDGAWEIKRNGEDDTQYDTVPTTQTVYLTRNDQASVSADVSDVYILRLKAGLLANGNNGYDRTLLLNGTAKNGDSIIQWAVVVDGTVTVKPPCCDGFPGGNTVQTKGHGPTVDPVTGGGGIEVWTVDFDAGGQVCFSSGMSGMSPTLYKVDLYDEDNVKLQGWSPTMPYGQVLVMGAFTTGTSAVYQSPDGTCYVGDLTDPSPATMQLKDPGRNVGPTLFGTE